MTNGPPAPLTDPGWARVLRLARRRLESTGGDVTGTLTVRDPTEAERKLIIGVTGAYRPPGVGSLTLPLPMLDAAVRRDAGRSLVELLTALGGPLRDRPGDRTREARARDDLLTDARTHGGPWAGEEWFAAWLDTLASDGTITRLVRRHDGDLLRQVGAVLTLLAETAAAGPTDPQRPVAPISLPVLAERATGDTKALSGTPAATLVLRALAARDGEPTPTTAAERRARWDAAGVILDDLASQVLVLGVRPSRDHPVAGWLTEAADQAIPFRLTLHQLTLAPLMVNDPNVFVCENPAVLRAAVGEWTPGHPPLVCTEGVPSAACHRLLAGARGTVHWRGDFDWTGLRTTADAIVRHDARPWRMAAADYRRAIDAPGAETEALRGAPAASPWDPRLAAALHERGRAVMEERIIPELLADLAAAATRRGAD
ncbi:TIGR02679 family protein [Nakamurella sp.]|uniref:TIGR02679 family protein n=1 Tax=Nakamurella sp. TaxID=1869182 RepID=UPI003B3A885A